MSTTIQPPALAPAEAYEKLHVIQEQFKEKMASYPTKQLPTGESVPDIPASDVEALRKMKADMDLYGEAWDSAKAIYQAEQEVKAREESMRVPTNRVPVAPGGAPAPERKTLWGELKAHSEIAGPISQVTLNSRKSWGFEGDVNPIEWLAAGAQAKTLMTTSSDGFPPEVLRTGGVTLSIQRPVQFIDVLPVRTTTQNGLKFMTETVFTDTADAQVEGAAVTDTVLTYAETTGAIRKIGAYIQMTEEQMADEPGIRDLVESRLAFMVRRELDRECLVGTGGANIVGLYNGSGVSTQAKGSDPIFDCMYKGMTKVRVDGRTTPELFVLHSTTWQSIRLTRTSDGVYIFGSPMDADSMRCWGLPVILDEELTGTAGSGTGLCAGVSEHVTLVMRQGVEIAMSDSAATTDFMKSILTLRATVRAGLEIRRAKCACTLTAL